MTAEEARPVDDVGASLANQLDELRILLRRVFEVGVLNHDEVARRFGEAAAQRGALALIALLKDQPESVFGLECREEIPRAVLRAVVNDDQLDADGNPEDASDDLFDGVPLVVHGHHDGQQRIGENPSQSAHARPMA